MKSIDAAAGSVVVIVFFVSLLLFVSYISDR